MSTELRYPADSLQAYVGDWWVETASTSLERGRLVKVFVPHVDQVPKKLVPEGRVDSTEHSNARFRIEALRASDPLTKSRLPIAALPQYPGECWIVSRAKLRPAVVVSAGGAAVPKQLRGGSGANWTTAPTVLVAPFYGASKSEKRSGWRPGLVERIKRVEFPQYLWDMLPGSGGEESILRLDHVQPIGRDHSSMQMLPYRLSEDALKVLDECLTWVMTGKVDENGVLKDVRSILMQEFGNPEA